MLVLHLLAIFVCLGCPCCCLISCEIPEPLRGQWFARENEENTFIALDDRSMKDKGFCYEIKDNVGLDYTIVFRNFDQNCFQCIRFFVRSKNVIEKMEGSCLNIAEHEASIGQVCQDLNPHQELTTLFSDIYLPTNCRSSLEGVWSFSYQNNFKFEGTCNNPISRIDACGKPEDSFNITYGKCDWIQGTYGRSVNYKCLGDWYIGQDHFIAVINPNEERREDQYRCFLKNDNQQISISKSAECSSLRTSDYIPETLYPSQISGCRAANCSIPVILRGQWFSWENGRNTLTELDVTKMSDRGTCHDIRDRLHVNYTIVFHNELKNCFRCVKLMVRTVNVLEKMEGACVTLPEQEATVERVCQTLDPHQQLITLFSENYVPVNCRSSLEGVWNFAYQNRFKFTGECKNPDAQIRSCQTAGSQFLITNQKFNITYKKCEGMAGTFDGVVEYSCLGDWFVGKNHYFAVANTKESRKDEKYRCFLRNRDDDLYVGVSITAECNTLKTVEKSPERLHVKPVKSEVVEPGCRLPQNFTGEWINTANIDADVAINETHIVETWYPDEGRFRRTIYVCKEQRDTRVMMARLTVDGCQKDYICFDFVPQHHNVIRYRKGIAVIKDDFSTVCSWVQFKNKIKWKYDLFLKKNPVPIKCPVAGKFSFIQKGDVPFETRILGGVTQSPRPNIYCKQNISDFSVCDEQKEIAIDENYCLSVDHRGKPVDIYSDPDYKMKCIGFWKENLKSYLITYDELDPFSKYRCWVYQRADLNRILMSQAIGPYCDLKQNVDSTNYTEGATVALQMEEYERERDRCPMYFDDGSNPWFNPENTVIQFDFGLGYLRSSGSVAFSVNSIFQIWCFCLIIFKYI